MDKPPINWCKIRNHHSLGNTHEMPMGGSAAGGLVAAVAHHRGTSVQQRIVLFHARHATSGPRGNCFFFSGGFHGHGGTPSSLDALEWKIPI